MKLYTLEYSFNKPMQQTITVGTNTDYMIGVSAVKNGQLLDLQPQDVTLTIGENVLTSEKLINGYVIFDYSQGRTPVSEIVKVTILDTQFELLIVGKFSSKGDVGGSGGVAEESDPVFVEKCLSANSVILGAYANGSENENVSIGNSATCNGISAVAIGANAFSPSRQSVAIGTKATARDYSVAIGSSVEASDNGIAIGNSTNAGGRSIVLGDNAKTNSQAYCVVIGDYSQANGEASIAIGKEAFSQFQSIAIGRYARANSQYSIQLGYGANDNESTLQVWDHTLLNKETGLIPPERLGTGYDSSQRQVLVNNYGTLTWETYNS